MNGLFEILSNKEWMIQQEFLHSILPTLQYNITNHASLGIDREKKSPMAIGQQGQDFIREYQVTEDGNVLPAFDAWGEGDVLGKMKEPFVNVMPVDGPITRNGGACSYGSRDIRDWMMKAADNKFCQCHVLHINTPGGSAWAKNDFQQGIDYAHSKGQRVIAFIDGLCASAGMYLASLCDEVYVMNPKDQLGCVGVMAAFFTMKNGDKDLSTGETYREYYDPESVDKNKEMRDIAEDEDATLLIEELKTLGEEFRADMKAAFPNAKDEHLKGKIFDAKDVMGILCDGQMMLGDVIARGFALADGTAQPIARTADRKMGTQASGKPATNKGNSVSTQLNNINMKEQFPAVFALLGVEEMQMQEGGAFVNTELLATLNANIEAAQKEAADAKALAESLTAAKSDLEQQLSTVTAEHAAAIEEKDNQISSLEQEKSDLTCALEIKTKSVEQLSADLDGARASLSTAEQSISERDKTIEGLSATIESQAATISDQQTTIAELNEGAGVKVNGGGAPQNNGVGVQAPAYSMEGSYDPSLSPLENKKRIEAYEAKQRAALARG